LINSSKKLAGPFLVNLRNKFENIAGTDQLIDREEFHSGLEIGNKSISNRLFEIFDQDKSGAIDFSEFMSTIEGIINGSDEDKIRFAFDLHDLDNSGFIDKDELSILIEQSFLENNLDYDEFQLDLLVDEFFKIADKDQSGTIDFGEFFDVAKSYPDFLSGFAVNPISWLNPERYDASENEKRFQNSSMLSKKAQVQDIGLFQWLLIPRLIFLYNILLNRKKNRDFVKLKAIHLLPSKNLELTISTPNGFLFTPGDYVYINCPQISKIEWYPFNIIHHSPEGDLVLHVKSNNKWTDRLYHETIQGLGKNEELNWKLRLDGPYGSSSQNILKSEHAILVGAGMGISRMAPILQDIAIRLQGNDDSVKLKRIDLFWLNCDNSYFEWFTKLLSDMDFPNKEPFFHYHIYFIDKGPEDLKEKMMYISTDVSNRKTDVTLIDNLWGKSKFGIPDWKQELKELKSNVAEENSNLFYSGPSNFKTKLKTACNQLNMTFNEGDF